MRTAWAGRRGTRWTWTAWTPRINGICAPEEGQEGDKVAPRGHTRGESEAHVGRAGDVRGVGGDVPEAEPPGRDLPGPPGASREGSEGRDECAATLARPVGGRPGDRLKITRTGEFRNVWRLSDPRLTCGIQGSVRSPVVLGGRIGGRNVSLSAYSSVPFLFAPLPLTLTPIPEESERCRPREVPSSPARPSRSRPPPSSPSSSGRKAPAATLPRRRVAVRDLRIGGRPVALPQLPALQRPERHPGGP